MPPLHDKIRTWAETRAYWEQRALFAIINGDNVRNDELLELLLDDHGLTTAAPQRPPVSFVGSDESTATAVATYLVEVKDVRNVNALVEDQRVSFSKGLTVIFGANGSGKSGYARLLRAGAFSRGPREILRDVTAQEREEMPQTATFVVSRTGVDETIQFAVGQHDLPLHNSYVFDAESAVLHLTRPNELTVAPAGLTCLTRLATTTDDVRDQLQIRISQASRAASFAEFFLGESATRKAILSLSADTDVEALCRLASISADEEKHVDEIKSEMARLRATDVATKLSAIDDEKKAIADLRANIERTSFALRDDVMREILGARANVGSLTERARALSIQQFERPHFSATGTREWRGFMEAARDLARVEGDTYPRSGDHCLLCDQVLSDEAFDRIRRLWDFLASAVQQQLDAASATLKRALQDVEHVSVVFWSPATTVYQTVAARAPELATQISAYIAQAVGRRQALLAARDVPSFGEDPDLATHLASIEDERRSVEEANPSMRIAQLEGELRELDHRRTLAAHLRGITEYVSRQRWARDAAKVPISTHNVTRTYNDLFTEFVTDRYVQVFADNLEQLGRPVRVRVDTHGQKGRTVKELVLEGTGDHARRFSLDRVLSDGEKRAVALADFLTEVALDQHSDAIILDDPVTSLDFEWKEVIAERLVREAAKRQVIVFTHDLHFLYLLTNAANTAAVPSITHWVKRGDNDRRPGHVFLENSPAVERDYRSARVARQMYERARNAPPSEQEMILKHGFGALRTSYEALVIFEIFNEVVRRFEERISIDRLNEVILDRSILDEVVGKVALLSRYIEGHLHSDHYAFQKPSPQLLLREIEDFETLRKRCKDAKKSES